MNVRETLMALFAQRRCVEIESGTEALLKAFGENDYQRVLALPGYGEAYNRIKAAKRTLERIGERYSKDNGDQPLQCLSLLHELRAETVYRSPDYDVTRELITKTLYADWSVDDQKRFDGRVAVFDDWTDFFISYTNRNAVATNRRYRSLITQELGWPRAVHVGARNYVARVVAKYLEQYNIRGFVDFKSLECGDDIAAKILVHCRSTVGFIQLVEREALKEPPPPTVNWCHKEYSEFTTATLPWAKTGLQANRRFFVLAGPALVPADTKPYADWYTDATKRLFVSLDEHNVSPFDTFLHEVGRVAGQIRDARDELVSSVLAAWA